MTSLNPSMRLKVKRDTFFLPDSNRGVYFRNNISSFRMKGSTIEQWVEKLIPMFNGEYTLGNLTEGLPGPYRDRVYEIAEVLYRNGFVRDVSQDHPHQLEDQVLKKHASQIEFVDSFVNSGAYRFQTYRQAKVLAVGSGPFFVALVSSLIDSGLPKFKLLITDTVPTNRRRLLEIVAHASKSDPEVEVEEVKLREDRVSSWRESMQPFDSILYVSQEGNLEELRLIHTVCREEKKMFLPAICIQQTGIAGPLVIPDSEACWESAWHRLHKSMLFKEQQLSAYSSAAGAMLANVIVFELFKEVTGVTEPEQKNQFFLLDLDTLEGNWHSFLPHPLVTGRISTIWVEDYDRRREQEVVTGESSKLLLYFYQLTSKETGIFHRWGEEELVQLPLAQCRVQAVDPLSVGPAELLSDKVCSGLTHEEARREAGLAGIEAYVSRIINSRITNLYFDQIVEGKMVDLEEFIGVGAGETYAEGVCRGLQKCLVKELNIQQRNQKLSISQVQLSAVEDERCRFYLQALSTNQREPLIGLGEEVSGFPVVYVRTREGWFRSVDLNLTMALRNALQQAISKVQNPEGSLSEEALDGSSLHLEEKVSQSLVIPACEERFQLENLQSALDVLKRNHKQLSVFEQEIEPFLKEALAGVFGVLLREEEIR
ncbi:putative thiazole-containing bacteriocin maturation protein [Neobacillus sp. MER 74]|uniref:putative thiazole-containing bacteriocin maturation protein n=1 Tax=Neobacillus sp. MER 74 TaxID=2939566 RepID=UPI00203E8596|nr:putative thiazole-containing bacteriocin maturation protein [Neobacillus sp. MER 74]MCM3117867.1 putative thiazole-containing bacteriocin maturation protein [Neobacillus sp. MER 74]